MSILLVGYSKIKTNMDQRVSFDNRVSFDDTNCSRYPSEEEWEKLCILAKANFLLQEKNYTQNELYLRCAQEKARLDARANHSPNLSQGDKQHVWNTPLTPKQLRDLIAEQVINQG
jgi:hypothetical protein